ncbi:hypothetical protein LIS77_25960 (plasmid) [Cytobacillus firmus]|uniref:hypothetical protein n=1 Tax=Cytobacillus firmus TaxID=1399 RepID=UPI0020795A33|nr:hypothetical protein [Cytobacillus firmus]USK41618.1 hypothetical protein LIS77_25960 [Cytobacillus firmus]
MIKVEQTDIFSMFDIEDEAVIKLEAAKAAAVKKREEQIEKLRKSNEEKKEAKASTPAAPKKDPFKVLVDTIVRYAGMDLPVTNYFSIEELENGLSTKKKKKDDDGEESAFEPISENALRKKLEDDFPELVANFTQLVYIEKKNIIVPVLSAKKKGMVDCKETSASAEVSSCSKKKKIPFHILADFIVVAKDFSSKFGTEVHADIYLDRDTGTFILDFPKQVVNPVLCSTDDDNAWLYVEKYGDRNLIKVMEIHSHHVMPAIPSPVDDANERSPILYAIVGRLDKFFPDLIVRTFNKETQKHFNINPSNVFENPVFDDYATYLSDISNVEVE